MKVYDVDEAAELLRISRRTVREYLKDGRLTGRKVGKRWLLTQEALNAFFADNDRNTPAQRHAGD